MRKTLRHANRFARAHVREGRRNWVWRLSHYSSKHVSEEFKVRWILKRQFCSKITRLTTIFRCAYQAHCRIHNDMGGNSFVCPECGENFGSDELEFRKHIKLHCAHTSKIQGFRCPVSAPWISIFKELSDHTKSILARRASACSLAKSLPD